MYVYHYIVDYTTAMVMNSSESMMNSNGYYDYDSCPNPRSPTSNICCEGDTDNVQFCCHDRSVMVSDTHCVCVCARVCVWECVFVCV